MFSSSGEARQQLAEALPLVEGTLYFLIPRASLAARRFFDVRAVYGQT